jgi:adenylate cyclase
MAKKKRKPILGGAWHAFAIGVLVVLVLFALEIRYNASLARAELIAYDVRIKLRHPPAQTGKVAIVVIDDRSIAELKQRWPWPRIVMAQLIDALKDYKVAVAGLDLIFSETDDQDVQRHAIAARLTAAGVNDSVVDTTLGPDNDAAFASALRAQGAIYLGYPFSGHYLTTQKSRETLSGYTTTPLSPPPLSYNLVRSEGPAPELLAADAYLPPIEILNRAAAGIAHVSVDDDADGELRSELMVVRFHDHYCVPLSLELVSAYRGHAPLTLEMNQFGVSGVAVGDEDIPVDEWGRMLVNFRGPVRTIPHYSASDVIARRVPAAALAGKIVLVGRDGTGLGDRVVTPVGSDFPGVEVHANAVDNILAGDFIHRSKASEAEQLVAALVLGLLIAYAVAHLSAAFGFAAFAALTAGYLTYSHYRLVWGGAVLNQVLPLLMLFLVYLFVTSYRYLTEGREKRWLRHAFEHYLNPDVIASVVDDPDGLKLGGSRRHLSILFADIVGFTTRAENAASPEVLIGELNIYFTRMVALILESGGVVDKLIGDAIMAFWGAPAKIENPARHAIDTALKMLGELAALRKQDQRFADFDVGIGIATGDPVVGNLGGETRFDYSVIGDSVNFASRLEGLTRKFGVHLLVSKNTLDEAGAANYIVREIGLVRVKGKREQLPIVEVVGRANDGVDPTFYRRFAGARELIAQGEDRRAVEELMVLKELRRDELGHEDHLIEMYLENLNHHLSNGQSEPLREMVFEFETK